MRLRILALSLSILLTVTLSGPATGKDAGETKLESQGDGLQTATFNTFSGTVTVNLPEDVVAGDTFSGTVVAQPSGDNEKKKEKNRGALVGYLFELGDHPRASVGDGRLTLDVPERRADGSVPTTATLILREVRKGEPGREIGRVEIPVLESVPAVPDFRLPTLSQQNVPLRVPGPFDGDLGSSVLRVGGVDVTPLAESPRGAIFRSPPTVSGVVPISLHERGEVAAEGELRNIGTHLSAPKSNLAAGESTTLTTRVVGLEDLDEEIPLRLKFWPPAIISVQGGYDHTKTIRPEDVGSDGTYSFGVKITGVAPGGWGASVRVKVPEPETRVVDHYVLVLEGRPVGTIEIDGALPGKTSAASDAVSFRAGLDLAQPFYDWMQSNFRREAQPKDGSIVGVDREGVAVEASEFKRATFDAVAFPTFDVEDRSPAVMTIDLAVDSVRYEKSAGKKKLDADGIIGKKTWQCSNFRFEIGGLPVERVSKIESFTWKQGITRDEVGQFREPQQAPAAVELPDLKLSISSADVSSWERWHRAFYIFDRSVPEGPDGRLVFLAPGGEEELGALSFHDATFSSLQVSAEDRSNQESQRVSIELAPSRLTLEK